MKRTVLAIMAFAFFLTSCQKETKMLILYYSQNGATERVAREIQKQTGADIESFDVVEAYDGDYDSTIKRCLEERESGFVPTLDPNPLIADISKYDVIFLGYPIWFGTYAPPVKALLQNVDLKGKTIVPFCTFGSGGLEASIKDLAEAQPGAEIAEGFGIRNARLQYMEEELNRFLIENYYKEGVIDPLPEYSEQDIVTPELAGIFDEAVQGYPFPMGDPVSVGSREVPYGEDYLFTVISADRDGRTAEGQVYVIRRDGRPVEFTKVVR